MRNKLTLSIVRNDRGDDCAGLEIFGKQLVLDPEQTMDLFNSIGEALEILGVFKECETCPNKDECDDYVCGEESVSCRLH